MTKLWNNVWVLGATVMGIAMSAPAAAVTSAVGPYYATPSWDQQLPASTRFIVLTNWGNAAVLDRETGLVWEQSPSTLGGSWYTASANCILSETGGRTGWRLPSIQELMSLVDRAQSNPALPPGHPFSNVPFPFIWASTSSASLPTDVAFVVNTASGSPLQAIKSLTTGRAWCVRGGSGPDLQ